MGALRRALDSLMGEGEFSVTVPPMDGALNPNNKLEEATLVASCEEPDNLCILLGRLIFSRGCRDKVSISRVDILTYSMICLDI